MISHDTHTHIYIYIYIYIYTHTHTHTHHRLLSFGLSSVSSIIQRITEEILEGLKHVCVRVRVCVCVCVRACVLVIYVQSWDNLVTCN